MNLNPGGKQPIMRDGKLPDGTPQAMWIFDDAGNKIAKGMREVLRERGLWKDDLRKICNKCKKQQTNATDCCATRILNLQADFAAQLPLLHEIVEVSGHEIIFYPKFHCELNFIEQFWGAAKVYSRRHCDYTWEGLQKVVPAALDSVDLAKIRRFARRSYRYMSTYRLGLTGKDAIMTVKKYKSHRRVPESAYRQVNMLFHDNMNVA